MKSLGHNFDKYMHLNKIKFIGFHILSLFLVALPFLASAQNVTPTPLPTPSPATSYGQSRGDIFGLTYECTSGGARAGECNFDDLIAATLYLVNWATGFALGFSVFVIAYAGFKYMISGDNASERKAANKMLSKVAIGIALIICAWLIVRLITGGLMVNTGITNLTTPSVP